MQLAVAREVTSLRRRINQALFYRGFVAALLVLVLICGGGLLIARLFDFYAEPRLWWLALLLPAILWGVISLRRSGISRADQLAHVDRRFGLGGLLLCEGERSGGPWQPELLRRLAAAGAAQPKLHPRPWLERLAIVSLFVVAVLLLPEPIGQQLSGGYGMLGAELESLKDQIELALEEGAVSDEKGEELEFRAKELQQRLVAGEDLSWSDIDNLADLLAHEESMHFGGLEAVEAGFDDIAQAPEESSPAEMAERFGELLQRAADLDMLDQLPQELRDKLGKGEQLTQGQSIDPAALGIDPADIKKLAKALGQAAQDQLGGLQNPMGQGKNDGQAGKPGGDGKAGGGLQDLKEMLKQRGMLGKGNGRDGGDGEGKGGEGGLDRGRGDADLNFSHDTQGDTEGMLAKKLPRGIAPPKDWQVVGVGRAQPEVDPLRAGAGSGPGAAGSGEATFHRRLAPRHRDIVRRYFSARKKNH